MSSDDTWEGPETVVDLNRLTPIERVARVERLVQGYHEVIAEGGTLATRVQALDNRGSELVTSLDRINKTATDLIALEGKVEDMEEGRREERAKTKARAFTAVVLLIMALGGIVFGYFYLRGGGINPWEQFKIYQDRRRLARLKKRFQVLPGGKDDDRGPTVH